MISTKTFITGFRSILALAAGLTLAGCPGTIPVEDRARFVGGGSNCGIALETVPSVIFGMHCTNSGCHDTSSRAGGLDLAAPNVASRLINVQSSTCSGHTLVVPGDVSHSFFFQKLNPNPACGTQMPNGMQPLAATDLACVQAWLRSLGGASDGGMDVVTPTDVPVGMDTPIPMDTPMPTDTGNDVRMDVRTDTPMPMDVPMGMDVSMGVDASQDVSVDTGTPPDTGPADTGNDDTASPDAGE